MKSTIIRTDGTCLEVEPKNKRDFQLDELQKIVDGYIEIVPISSTQCMVVNEEGKLKGMGYNHYATLAVRMAGINDVIVGDVLVCDNNKIR